MVNIYIGRYVVMLTKLQFCYVVTLKSLNFVTSQQNFRYVVTLVLLVNLKNSICERILQDHFYSE